MALRVVCGGECNINVQGNGTTTLVHWGLVNGTVAVGTGTVRPGGSTKSYVFVGGTTALIRRICASSQTVAYLRFYFQINTITPNATCTIAQATGTNNHFIDITTSGVLRASAGGASATGPQLVANRWYGVEAQFDGRQNPMAVNWRVYDSSTGVWTTQTSASAVLAGQSFTAMNVGCTGTNSSTTVVVDDILMGEDTTINADYSATIPNGGTVIRYLPIASSGSFNLNDFIYNAAGGSIATNATDMHTYVDDDDQTSAADFLKQGVSNASAYIDFSFAQESVQAYPRAVAVTRTYHASGTTANAVSLKLSDDAFSSTTTVDSLIDVSDTTIHPRHTVYATAPSGAAWSQANINSLHARYGYSNNVATFPYLDTVSLEVAWTENLKHNPMGSSGFFNT